MQYKITNEQPFQVLCSSFSISPSQQNYTLNISADGKNYSPLFTVASGQTRLVTGVASGSYYKLVGNQSEVTVNWVRSCNDGGGGAGGNAGELEPVTDFPVGAPAGTVVALSSGGTVGVYQYDGTDWTPIGGGDMSDYYTKAETDAAITGATQGFATEVYVTAATAPIQTQLDDVERVTATALTELHDTILEISGSTYTKAETDAAITGATQGFATEAYVTAATANLMTSAATQTMINAATSGITAELADLEDMMETKEEVIAAALVDLDGRIPDMSNYYTSAQTQNAITAATQGFVTSGDVATQISTATANMVESTTITTIWSGTQAQYDLIVNPDPNTFYIITNS